MLSLKNSLSNFDIMKIIQSQGVDDFKGVYMKDQLPDKLERGSYIINYNLQKKAMEHTGSVYIIPLITHIIMIVLVLLLH